MELVLERRRVLSVEVLYVHWLSLRNPRAQFSDRRPRLPGQEVPGLGLAREAGTMLARMAVRLGFGGVVYRPAFFHTAYAARHEFAFIDPERQGRFEALVRDLANVPLLEATIAVAEGACGWTASPTPGRRTRWRTGSASRPPTQARWSASGSGSTSRSSSPSSSQPDAP